MSTLLLCFRMAVLGMLAIAAVLNRHATTASKAD